MPGYVLGNFFIYSLINAFRPGLGNVLSLTFAASVNPIRYEKAVPVFIDSERDTWNMDAAALRKAFEKYPHPKAFMAVHLYGTSANMDEIILLMGTRSLQLQAEALWQHSRKKMWNVL